MTSARDHMSKADTVTIAAIEAGVPTLVAARTLTDRFHTMIRNRKEADLVPWIAAASDSLIGSFASGVTKDIAAVHAALVQAVVERPDRRPDHQAQARQATDVRQSKDRSPSGKIDRRDLSGGEHHRDCVRALIPRRNTEDPF